MCAHPPCKREMGPPVDKGNGKTQELSSATEMCAKKALQRKQVWKNMAKG